jgi:hypothetical protein
MRLASFHALPMHQASAVALCLQRLVVITAHVSHIETWKAGNLHACFQVDMRLCSCSAVGCLGSEGTESSRILSKTFIMSSSLRSLSEIEIHRQPKRFTLDRTKLRYGLVTLLSARSQARTIASPERGDRRRDYQHDLVDAALRHSCRE